MTRWIGIAVVVAALGAVGFLNLGPKDKVRIQVQTEPARSEPITQVVTASGKIRPVAQVKISADVGGYIRKLTVKQGDVVKAGDLLVQVDPEIYRARVLEAQAGEQTTLARMHVAEASRSRANGEVQRVKGLHDKELTSSANLEKAQADFLMAQAEVEAGKGQWMQAQAMLGRAKKDLEKCTINAPMSGRVVELNKELGERVSGGDFREDIIMTVADLSQMEVEVEVGERDVVLIHLEDHADIDVDAYPGRKVSGNVKEIANAGITRNQWTESEVTNFRVVVLLAATELVLRPQMSATVGIKTAFKDQALTVPIQSVTLRRPSELKPPQPGEGKKRRPDKAQDADGPQATTSRREEPVEIVFVFKDGKAMAQEVKTGLSSDTRIEIVGGLQEGTQVISGPYRVLSKDLKSGDDVQVGTGNNGKSWMGKKSGPPKES